MGKGNDKGSFDESTCHRTWLEAKDLRLHSPRPLPYQDAHKTSDKGWCACDLWQGDQGEGEASQDRCESFPSRCTEEANLKLPCAAVFITFPEGCLPWESHEAALEGTNLTLAHQKLRQC